MEKRFEKDPELKLKYAQCINEYIQLQHMQQVFSKEETHTVENNGAICYSTSYLPHHAVIKESSSTTKLRVVFDASQKTDNGRSLNSTLMIGPKLQDDIFSILIRWRLHKIAFTADIEKMYRQISVTDKDAEYQRIVWRDNPTEKIKDYRMSTVTFGTSSAPYMAIKTLQQIAKNEEQNYPEASDIIMRDFYVDDLISGANSVQEAINMQNQLIKIFKTTGFEPKKWTSNHTQLLENVPKEHREINLPLEVDKEDSIKALGIHWHPATDHMSFKVNLESNDKTPTKRTFLSNAAKLYDPIGWLAPIIVVVKIMFQQLWIEGIDWDDQIPSDMNTVWQRYQEQLKIIEEIKIPRWINNENIDNNFQIHGFSDASEKAYAAAVYARSIDSMGKIHIQLIASKTKVAPLKQISLPKLELCAAVLLSKLMTQILNASKIDKRNIHA